MSHSIRLRPITMVVFFLTMMLSSLTAGTVLSSATAQPIDTPASLATAELSITPTALSGPAEDISYKSKAVARVAAAQEAEFIARRKARAAAHRKMLEARAAAHREWQKAPSYKVRSGDTLSEITTGFGADNWHATAASPWNHIDKARLIYPGQKLHVLGAKREDYADPAPSASSMQPVSYTTTNDRTSAAPSSAPAGTDTCTDGGTSVSYNYYSERQHSVLEYACAQTAKPYVYGAAGPNAYDCSGLTMMAYAQAGVSLPHRAIIQSGMGRSVSESDLRPGDLVFYYSPVSHVGMYIGDGKIVNAANPGAGVTIYPLHSMPLTGMRRFITAPAPKLAVKQTTAPSTRPASDWRRMTHLQWVTHAGIKASNFGYVNTIVAPESGWNPHADNPHSSAYGLPQALPGSKMSRFGGNWHDNPIVQLHWMNWYVHDRYGSWAGAVYFRRAHGWY